MISRCTRAIKHLGHGPWTVRKQFPQAVLDRIELAVTEGEQLHSAEIRLAVEGSLTMGEVLLQDVHSRERALDLFADLHVWDTAANNGILIYLLLADHEVQVLADRAANAQMSPAVWEQVVSLIRDAFARGEYESGVVSAVRYLSQELAQIFPAGERNPDELPNRPATL